MVEGFLPRLTFVLVFLVLLLPVQFAQKFRCQAFFFFKNRSLVFEKL